MPIETIDKEASRTLSATDLVNAWYLGVSVRSNVINARNLVRSLRNKGLTKGERKEVIGNVERTI